MVTLDDVAAIALGLPDVTERDRGGLRTWWVGDPHFDGYPAVLIQLDAVEPEAMRAAIVDGWRARAR